MESQEFINSKKLFEVFEETSNSDKISKKEYKKLIDRVIDWLFFDPDFLLENATEKQLNRIEFEINRTINQIKEENEEQHEIQTS